MSQNDVHPPLQHITFHFLDNLWKLLSSEISHKRAWFQQPVIINTVNTNLTSYRRTITRMSESNSAVLVEKNHSADRNSCWCLRKLFTPGTCEDMWQRQDICLSESKSGLWRTAKSHKSLLCGAHLWNSTKTTKNVDWSQRDTSGFMVRLAQKLCGPSDCSSALYRALYIFIFIGLNMFY